MIAVRLGGMITILSALVPVSQPSVAGTRACRPATSADRLAAATPSPPPASFRRSAPVGVPLPSVAAGPRRLGTRQTGDSGQMASPRLSDLLVVAITLSRTPQDERRNQGPDPSDESRQSALGRASSPELAGFPATPTGLGRLIRNEYPKSPGDGTKLDVSPPPGATPRASDRSQSAGRNKFPPLALSSGSA